MKRLWLTVLACFVLGCGTQGRAQGDLSSQLNARIGVASRADFVQAWGTPAQRVMVEGDEFWIYLVPETTPPTVAFAQVLGGFTGSPIEYQPGMNELILRFDGTTGKLKAWNIRQ